MRILSVLVVAAFAFLGTGCGAPDDLNMGNSGLWGSGKNGKSGSYTRGSSGKKDDYGKKNCNDKKSHHGKTDNDSKGCYYECLKKGLSGEKCKYYCSKDKKEESKDSTKECYGSCLKKGLSAEKCKHYCYKDEDKGKDEVQCKEYKKDGVACKVCWDDEGNKKEYCDKSSSKDDPKACYYGCQKKGIDAAKCKAICYTDTDKKEGTKGDPKACYYGCQKKGIDAAKCKAICYGGADETKVECKEYKTKDGVFCKVCSNGKKYCDDDKKDTKSKVECKEYKTKDGSICKACTDGYKACSKPSQKVECKEVKTDDGRTCKVCSDGKKYCG